MTSLKIPDRYLQLSYRWTGPGTGSQPVTVLGVLLADGADPLDISNDVQELANALVKPACDSYSITAVQAVVGNDTGPPYLSQVNPLDVATGHNPGEAAPPNVAGLISKSTATPGRQGRGRLYLPGVPEGNIDDGGQTNGTLATQMTELAEILTTLPSPFSGGIESFALFHPIGSEHEGPSTIGSFAASTTVATQRRRLRR